MNSESSETEQQEWRGAVRKSSRNGRECEEKQQELREQEKEQQERREN